MPISFLTTPADCKLIGKIAARAAGMDKQHNLRDARDIVEWDMDFTATHANGNPLRLADLLAADDFNFAHDAFGIARHLDRSTGKLTRCFVPRFSQPAPAEAA